LAACAGAAQERSNRNSPISNGKNRWFFGPLLQRAAANSSKTAANAGRVDDVAVQEDG
jgi:hypothetical protein